MNRLAFHRSATPVLVIIVGLLLVTVALSTAASVPRASADTDPGTLFGEGGSLAEPIVNDLLIDDTQGLGSVSASYFESDIDVGRQDFASGNDDFAVSELPLTSAEATTAQTNGRSFAYVPFAAEGIAASAVVVCNASATAGPAAFCPGLQVTANQLEGLFTQNIETWNDTTALPTISGGTGPVLPAAGDAVKAETLVDPSAETEALEQYFDNDSTAGPAYQTWATGLGNGATGTPSEYWPIEEGVTGGDLGLANTLMPVNEETLLVEPDPSTWGEGEVAPLAVDWLGNNTPDNPRYLPALAVQNAQGSFVQPTQSAEQAAVNDATVDPTTNLVTFQPNGGSDAAAYPIMVMSYLIVPTTGLSAAKATALSQFIQFILGSQGQKDITGLGGASVTPAMASAGMAVASTLAAQGGTSTTTTTTAAAGSGSKTTTSTTMASTSSKSSTDSSSGSSSSDTDDLDSSGLDTDSGTGDGVTAGVSLAATGTNPMPLGGIGLAFGVIGFVFRRRFRRLAKVGA